MAMLRSIVNSFISNYMHQTSQNMQPKDKPFQCLLIWFPNLATNKASFLIMLTFPYYCPLIHSCLMIWEQVHHTTLLLQFSLPAHNVISVSLVTHIYQLTVASWLTCFSATCNCNSTVQSLHNIIYLYVYIKVVMTDDGSYTYNNFHVHSLLQ